MLRIIHILCNHQDISLVSLEAIDMKKLLNATAMVRFTKIRLLSMRNGGSTDILINFILYPLLRRTQ